MAEFHIRIAGRVAAVTSLFDSSRDYCRRYLCDERPDFSVTVTREDLAFEQAFLLEEARQEGLRPRVFADPFLDRAAIQRQVAEKLLSWNVLLIHGSAVAVDGQGYLFTAGCGTGKSTHTRLWRQVFGDRAVMVNDDKPFVRVEADGVFLCGAPWSGKHGLDTNVTVPLKGICLLERGQENRMESMEPQHMAAWLRHESCAPRDAGQMPRFEALVAELAAGVPLWRMACNRDPAAARIAHGAMANKMERSIGI